MRGFGEVAKVMFQPGGCVGPVEILQKTDNRTVSCPFAEKIRRTE